MTYRPRPVGSCGGAEAILVGMAVQVTHDDVIGDVARGGREVAPRPETLAPVALADMLELLLDFARRAPLGHAHEVADPDVGRDFDEHVDMIARQRPADDGHAHLGADLPDDVAHPRADLAVKHLVTVLGRPDDVIAMVKKRVTAGRIACRASRRLKPFPTEVGGLIPKAGQSKIRASSLRLVPVRSALGIGPLGRRLTQSLTQFSLVETIIIYYQ